MLTTLHTKQHRIYKEEKRQDAQRMYAMQHALVASGIKICAMCDNIIVPESCEKHHLEPITKDSKKGREYVNLHSRCHGALHTFFENDVLRTELNTAKKLRANSVIVSWKEFVKVMVDKKGAEWLNNRKSGCYPKEGYAAKEEKLKRFRQNMEITHGNNLVCQ